jgi:hypothetical protein
MIGPPCPQSVIPSCIGAMDTYMGAVSPDNFRVHVCLCLGSTAVSEAAVNNSLDPVRKRATGYSVRVPVSDNGPGLFCLSEETDAGYRIRSVCIPKININGAIQVLRVSVSRSLEKPKRQDGIP